MTDPPTNPTVLDYATFDADGMAPFDPRAEAMIDAGAPPSSIRKFFRTSSMALKYFVKSMRRRHAIETLSETCEICGQACPVYLTVDWRVMMRLTAKEMAFRSPPSATFRTTHTICPACRERWDRRLRRNRRLEWIALGMVLLGWAFYIATQWLTPPPSWPATYFVARYGFAILCLSSFLPQFIVFYWLAGYPRELGLPRRMRCRMISPLVTRPVLDDIPPAAIVEPS